jgi:hypothetical protein
MKLERKKVLGGFGAIQLTADDGRSVMLAQTDYGPVLIVRDRATRSLRVSTIRLDPYREETCAKSLLLGKFPCPSCFDSLLAE